MIQKITISTNQKKEVSDITKILNDLIMKNNYPEGVVLIFLHHTSCALTIADLDPGTDNDYLMAFEELVPKLNYSHPHDPKHVADHILSATIGTSLVLPVQSANILLGSNQRIVLMEFNGPKERRLSVTFLPLAQVSNF